MLQKYKEKYLDPLSLPLRDYAFWNSTAKALLIHTATDLVKETAYLNEKPNPDTDAPVLYHEGPDYATGWGLVNARKATAHVDTNLFKEDSVADGETMLYKFRKNTDGACRVTIAWDDPSAAPYPIYTKKLINNIDMYVIDPNGNTRQPWHLDTLPHSGTVPYDGIDSVLDSADIKPAYKGTDNRNNVEVVDITNAPAGEYMVVIKGTSIQSYPALQHFSLVTSDSLWFFDKVNTLDTLIIDSTTLYDPSMAVTGGITIKDAVHPSGSEAEWCAGDSIVLKPETHIEEGSEMHLYIRDF
jgi:hypothetical protein